MAVAKVSLFNATMLDIEGKVWSYNGYHYEIEVELPGIHLNFEVPRENLVPDAEDEFDFDTNPIGATVRLKFK